MESTIVKQLYHFNDHTTECEICNFPEHPEYTVLYLHGLKSNPWSRKANAIKAFCQRNNLNFQRYTLLGHEHDAHNFDECDFEIWKEQYVDIIENHIQGPIIIVGHCIGGWLGLFMAEKYPERIKGFLGLATAPDLIEQLIERSTLEQRQTLADTGRVEAQVERFLFVFSQHLWTSLNVNNILKQKTIDITCPIHLIHGQLDTFVKWEVIFKLAQKIQNPQLVTKLLKSSNHHLQDTTALSEIGNSLQDLYLAAKKKGG